MIFFLMGERPYVVLLANMFNIQKTRRTDNPSHGTQETMP